MLKHEAIDYIRGMKRRASRETSLERLPQTAMDKLYSTDDCPSDSYVFSYCGYDLPMSSEQVADAFAGLSEQAQSILVLRLVLDLTDSGIVDALVRFRSAVQRRGPRRDADAVERVLRYYEGYINELCTRGL